VRTLLRLPGLARALVTSSVILAAVDISLVYLPALGAEHQLSSSLIGLLLALRAGASMVSRLFLGRLTALIGRRRLLVVSTLIAAISTALIPLPMPIPLIAVAVVLTGFGLGVGQPVTMAWLAEASPPGLRGRSMSLRLVGNRTGQLLIPSAVGVVAVGLGSAGVLWVTAAALAVVAVSARRITQNPLNPPPPQPA
jgi:MFS family permease